MSEKSKPNRKLNAICFALPLALTMPAFFIEGATGLLGLFVSFICSLFASYTLVFWPPLKTRQAAWSYLFRFTVAIGFCVWGAYLNLAEQQSPWLP